MLEATSFVTVLLLAVQEAEEEDNSTYNMQCFITRLHTQLRLMIQYILLLKECTFYDNVTGLDVLSETASLLIDTSWRHCPLNLFVICITRITNTTVVSQLGLIIMNKCSSERWSTEGKGPGFIR